LESKSLNQADIADTELIFRGLDRAQDWEPADLLRPWPDDAFGWREQKDCAGGLPGFASLATRSAVTCAEPFEHSTDVENFDSRWCSAL
jgi:hypothetical protein